MRSLSTNPNKRKKTKLIKSAEIKKNNSSKALENPGSSLANFLNFNNKNYFVTKNKNLLHDYDRYLQVKRERKKGIVFSALKKISYEEKKKNETFNLYNKYPFNEDPRLIMSNYNLLKEYTVEEKTVAKNRILGVDEGYIKLPKLNKDTNYINLFLGHNAMERTLFSVTKDNKGDNGENERLLTINENSLNKNLLLSKRNKNPMLLDRGQEFCSYFANLNNRFKTKSEKNMEKIKNMIEVRKYKNIEKKKENYENKLQFNYEIKCLDNWDFEHVTKTNDLKNDSKFKNFLNEVDNSQMKWIIEIKNDKEQLKLMRRNRHLFDFLTQIDKEQQAMLMQNMSLYKKGFNFDIFNGEESEVKNNETVCKTENNNVNNSGLLLNEEEVSNNNISQVEFYRQVMKEKKKLEEMFQGELRTVAEECYITNLNKKNCVINAFEITQELTALSKKEEIEKQNFNNKIKSLQKKKKRDRKRKVAETKLGVNIGSLISAKNNNFLLLVKEKKDYSRKISDDDIQSEKTTSKSINFRRQSLFLAEKNAIENEYNEKMTGFANKKLKLNEDYKKLNKEIKYWDAIHKKERSKLEQRIKALSTYYYQILKKGIDVRHTGLTWVIVRLLELGAFVDKPHFPSFLNDEQILYLMKIGTKTYELSEFIKLFQILKKKQKTLREKHLNDNIKKEKMLQQQKSKKTLKRRKDKNFLIGDDYMEYIEEIQRKYENVINICLNENKEESNIAKISYDLKQYILQDKIEEDNNKNDSKGKGKKLELLFIPGSLSEYFAQDKRFRQYFDDVFYLNDEINKRRDILNKEKQEYLNQYRSKILRGALFGSTEVDDNKYKKKKTKENEIVYAALFGNGISV